MQWDHYDNGAAGGPTGGENNPNKSHRDKKVKKLKLVQTLRKCNVVGYEKQLSFEKYVLMFISSF